MKSRLLFCALIVAVAGGAVACRLPRLSQRPMHTDEAVQAIKTGDLVETGVYRYDPIEYHGPTLYYFSLPSLWLTARGKLADSNERTFRVVPVVFGVGLVLLLLLMGDGLGRPAAVWAAVFTAISPAMVFYSRFYIQEMLLVFFTFAAIAAGWRYAQSRRLGWALVAGAALGLMHATKETCIIAYGSMLAALVLCLLWGRRDAATGKIGRALDVKHLVSAAVLAWAVSVVLFSSFFANLSGPLDSLRTYIGYLNRGAGASVHVYPWHYYLKMLIYTKFGPGPWWSEGLIVGLSAIGLVAVITGSKAAEGNPSLLRFIALYAVFMTVAYSIIPYKTPWCMLGFLHGMILLAGVGAAFIVKSMPNISSRVIVVILLVAGCCHLAWQAYRGSFQFYADNRNPYVYAHPVNDVLRLVERVEDIARIHPDGHNMLIKVIAPDADYWPLPWYLRRSSRVGYWSEVPDEPDAPVIIASALVQSALDKKVHDSYQISCYGLRPQVLLLLYVKTDVWNAFMEHQPKPKGP
jgi:uncharacterized protein (TIGR03663 family)